MNLHVLKLQLAAEERCLLLLPLKMIVALSSCPPDVKKNTAKNPKEVHRSLWELRKEKRWLSEKAKLLENLPRERQNGILSLYLKTISKCPSALRHPSLLQHTHS